MRVPGLHVRSSTGPESWLSRATLASRLDDALLSMEFRRMETDVAHVEVDRRCVVCEWTGTVKETADTLEIGGQCPACHAPTERVRVRRRYEHVPNVHAAALGRLGGLKGGPARAAALSPKRRREIARAAAAARWKRG